MNGSRALPRFIDRLAFWVLPAHCLACRTPLPAGPSDLGLCSSCRKKLEGLAIGTVCERCSEPLGASCAAVALCGHCLTEPPAFDRLLTPWRYGTPLDSVVQAFKFGRLDYLGHHLARSIVSRLGDRLGRWEPLRAGAPVPLVSHVPLHWMRRLRRGYDQAREIAIPLARALSLPYRSVLVRRRNTPAQSSLERDRRLSNLELAFRVRRGSKLSGRTVWLVDDVATTGATLNAASRMLKAAGAREVVAIVAARTPNRSI